MAVFGKRIETLTPESHRNSKRNLYHRNTTQISREEAKKDPDFERKSAKTGKNVRFLILGVPVSKSGEFKDVHINRGLQTKV
jgi:predicted secreted Zn-dependent protease